MNESRENNLRTFPSDSSLTEHINSMPSPRQSKVMKPKATLETINENDNDENVLNASDCGKTPFPHKLKNENNLASVDNHPNRRSTRLRKEPGVEFQYIESKHCDNEESNFSSENSTINENDHENVQTRIENYNLSPRIRLGNELFSQNHAQANNNRPNQHTGNRERINDHNQPSNANPQQNVDAYRALSQRVSQEVHVLLRTHLEFYCFTIATYIILFLINREITTLFAEIVAVWVYILVQIIETLEIQVRQENHSVNQKRKLFVLFDWICVLIFTVGLALKAGVTSEDRVSIIFTPFCAPGLLNILVYSFTKTPQSGILKKRISVLKRIILWAQLVLAALKVDGYLDADWMITFVIAKIGLGILIFYSLFPLFIFINVVITTLRGIRVMGRLPIKVQLVGFGWSFITSLFSTFWMIVLFGTDDLLEENSYSELLNSGLIASFVHVGILMLTTLLLRPYLKVFLRYLFLQSISNRTRAREARIEYNVRFEVIDPEPIYLLPISSTFHQMLHEEMSSYTKEELQQWKNQIHKTRKLKYLRTETKTNSGSPKKNQIDGQKTCTKLNHSADFATHHGQEDESLVFGHRPNFTSDDLEIYENIKRPTKQEAREAENMCYVCVQRPPTAIIMDCGHSGICYECAIEGWRKDEKCMMCRQRVNNILKVKFYEKLNISKSIHGTKKIVDVPAEN